MKFCSKATVITLACMVLLSGMGIPAYAAADYVEDTARFSPAEEAPPMTKISMDPSLTLNRGESRALTVRVSPENAAGALEWTSDNPKMAKVDPDGRVTAITKGTANITAAATDGSGLSATCAVTVKQPVTKLTLNIGVKTVRPKKTCQLEVTLSPADANDKTLEWKSSAPGVARVSGKGLVTGIKKGKSVITVTSKDGGNAKAKATIYVGKPVKSVTLNQTKAGIKKGKKVALKATVKPAGAVRKKLQWKSSNTNVATVNSKGTVLAIAKGKTTITATTTDGTQRTAKATVYVNAPVKSVKLNKKSLKLNKGQTATLKAKVKPSHAANKAVKWTSSNRKVATVSAKGKVKAVGAGKATIKAKSKSGGIVAKCKVTVTALPPLFNYANPIPANYALDLVSIGNGQSMQRKAAGAFTKMQAAAAAEGVSLIPVSGYRSNAQQTANYNNSIRRYLASGYSEQDAIAMTQRYYAIPGTSEHEAGLAIDINSVQAGFEQTAAFAWMQKNGSDYGFILRYKQNTEAITHIAYEPWHYRYVGKKHAKKIEKRDITLEEYVQG